GEALRRAAGVPFQSVIAGDPSRWDVRLWTAEQLEVLRQETQSEQAVRLAWPALADLRPLSEVAPGAEEVLLGSGDAEPVRRELEQRLQWRYPWTALAGRPAKQGVSELKRRWEQADDETARLWAP